MSEYEKYYERAIKDGFIPRSVWSWREFPDKEWLPEIAETNLIAAAPELLEACKIGAGFMTTSMVLAGEDPYKCKVLAQINKAIDRAEGK